MEQQKLPPKKNLRSTKSSFSTGDRAERAIGLKHDNSNLSGQSAKKMSGARMWLANLLSNTDISDALLGQVFANKSKSKAALVAEARRVFGSSTKAKHWLHYPRHQFGGKTPFEMTSSEKGRLAVEEILGQIEHGMFS